MKKQELQRLAKLENRLLVMAEEEGLTTTEVIFEVVPAHRMIEAMAYGFPTNYSHWSFGRDYDFHRTVYDHTGAGIPYEQVWNLEPPRALLVATNPFALNVLTIAHVLGHVDFFLENRLTSHGRDFSNIADEARSAMKRFKQYESRYGQKKVEGIIDAGLSLQWHKSLERFIEEPSDDETREHSGALIREKIRIIKKRIRELGKERVKREVKELKGELWRVLNTTPPEPRYDILRYFIEHAPRLRDWERDILTVIRNQARALAPNRSTKLLNEGWATYWHTRLMRRLFEEKLLSDEEHGIFLNFHAKVTQASKMSFNVYNIGPALFEYVEESWDKGRFGEEYETCSDPLKKSLWDTGAGLGKKKIFGMRSYYTDRMAIEEFFTPEFINELELYFYEIQKNPDTGEIEYIIVEKDPEVIQRELTYLHTLFNMPSVAVVNGDHNSRGDLYLRHDFEGIELDDKHAKGTIRHTHYAWRKPVFLETVQNGKAVLYHFSGKEVSVVSESGSTSDDGLKEL